MKPNDALLLHFGEPVTPPPMYEPGDTCTFGANAPTHPDGWRSAWVLHPDSGRVTDPYGAVLSA